MKKYTYYIIALLALFVSCDDAEFAMFWSTDQL